MKNNRTNSNHLNNKSTETPKPLEQILAQIQSALHAAAKREQAPLHVEQIGAVHAIDSGVAWVHGLDSVQSEELVRFGQDLFGLAYNLDEDEVGVILLDEDEALGAGDTVHRTHRVADVPVGETLLGRMVDALGRPLDDQGPIRRRARRPVERPAPEIMDRAPVTVPLQTGLKVIDALIPVGRGQRELIIGDRQTGKTAIALDTIINQRETDVVCVYCAIGQRKSAVADVVGALRDHHVADQTVVVTAHGDDPPGLRFVAPYAATTMAEWFMDQGSDVLIVYDDLTQHARAYRELSLLLRRPPGREAYPGDIFYIHSRLLERATHLRDDLGGGSLTALPIIETQAQNISAYIPTNLISITDGQIYLSPGLFQKGIMPAVDVGRSVSRVGGKTQLAAYQAVAGDLRLSYTQFTELESFARFGAHLDDETQRILRRGRHIREILQQPQFAPLPVPEQIAVLLAASEGLFDRLPLARMAAVEHAVRRQVMQDLPDLAGRLAQGEELDEHAREQLLESARHALDSWDAAEDGEQTHADA